MGKRSREAAQDKSAEESKPKSIKVQDEVTPTNGGSDGGAFNAEEKAWEWEVARNLKLRVSKFKGQTRVDIRYLAGGQYTKKGVSLTLEAFEAIRNWDKYADAIKTVNEQS
eukprot:Blabericola_migrator_1__5485@NODE_27_length_20109_cov_273_259006_g24_i0_p14_GENE_NODE_27_length_20109_cov_273_259006_g24_i0NODE_27_length_20109_cov_273_259006_g24_i0_p14_ORF_typecomplete_len111_score26_22PC4/PF02229_16/3_7e08_NODE_27_length_20109_cov_273_259006_g24_i01886019192